MSKVNAQNMLTISLFLKLSSIQSTIEGLGGETNRAKISGLNDEHNAILKPRHLTPLLKAYSR